VLIPSNYDINLGRYVEN